MTTSGERAQPTNELLYLPDQENWPIRLTQRAVPAKVGVHISRGTVLQKSHTSNERTAMADRVVIRNDADRTTDVRDREGDGSSWLLPLLLILLTLFVLWWLFFPRGAVNTTTDTTPNTQNSLELDVNEGATTPAPSTTTEGSQSTTEPTPTE